ncbi:MAG: hypothetical protein Q4B28_05905 [bacterium]|nr:hypothetical protein [bacterium]
MKNNSTILPQTPQAKKTLNFKEKLQKRGTGLAIAGALLIGNPSTANAQNASNPNSTTEQVEKEHTPNYIAQAPQKLQEFYPQYTEHFNKIFEVVKNTNPEVLRVINQKLQESLQTYSVDIATEKDKRTTILMFMELAYPDTKFTKENEQLDEDGLDMRQI